MDLKYISGLEYYKRFECPSDRLKDSKIHNLNVYLAHHCNLNCAYCSYFAPIAPTNLPDTKQIEKDLKRISELTKNKPIDNIFLMGGEPLLNPKIIHFMKYSRELFPTSIIYIFTNGILLKNMPIEFWNAAHDYNINLLVTRYFEDDIFYKEIIELAHKYQCHGSFALSSAAASFPLFTKNQLSEDGYLDYKEAWEKCPAANCAISLVNGKLYPCSICAFIKFLNMKFNTKFEIFKEDAVDIYENDYDTIIKELSRPKRTCQYCDPNTFETRYFLKHSKKEKSEWVKCK